MSELNEENKPELEAGSNEAAPAAEGSANSGKKQAEKIQADIQNGNPAKRKLRLNFRSLKRGTMSVVLTVLFIAAVVVLNVIVGIISDRVDTTVDLTDTGIYTLDESTTNYLGKLSMDVTVSVMNSETNFEGGGTYYKSINELLKKMSMENGHFKLMYRPIDQNPQFTAEFTGETLNENYIVVKSEETGRHRILTQADYFSTQTARDTLSQYGYPETSIDLYIEQYINSSYASQVIEGSNVEQAVISALLYVTNTDPVRVAFTEGFGEGDSSSLSYLLNKNGYDVETINLINVDSVDSEIDYIVMYAPTMDYDNESLNKLAAFLDNDGAFGKNLLYFANSKSVYQSEESSSLTNISAFLAEWGISVGDSYIMQSDPSYMFVYDMETYSLPGLAHVQNIQDTAYAGDIYGNSLFTYDSHIRPIIQLWENGGKGSVEQQILIKSYDGAYLRPINTLSDENFDISSAESGEFIDALCAYKTHSTTQKITRVIAFGSDMFAGSICMDNSNANNQNFLINMFNYISGKTEGVTITTKSVSKVGFDVNMANSNILAVVLCIVIPIAVVALGVVIWVRRRHR